MRIETLFYVLLALALGCGGGGGGGASGPSSPVYTGPTTPAVIGSTTDAQNLVNGAVNGSEAAAILMASTQGPPRQPLILPNLVRALTQVAHGIKPGSGPAAGNVISGVGYGPCGGTVTLSATGNGTTAWDYKGTMVFSNYCITATDGTPVVVDGITTFSMNGPDDQDYNFSLVSSYLALTEGGQAYIFSLDVSGDEVSGQIGAVTLNCTYLAPDQKVYMVTNYQVTATATTVSISGTFYDPAYGYVTVATSNPPLTFSDCSGTTLPISGWVRVTGANGYYGELDPLGCANYNICFYNGTSNCQTTDW